MDKQAFYWINTIKYCGGVTVNEKGEVDSSGTAPCYKWMSGKKFSKMLSWLKYKKYLKGCSKL